MYTLYTTPLSANGRKVLALGRHLGLEPQVVEVDVYRGEGQASDYRSVNPWGKIPTLVDGDLKLWESNAIAIYLCEAYGDNRLWSAAPRVRADIARWLFWESSHWQPALTETLRAHAAHALLPDVVPKPASAPQWESPLLQPLLQHLNAQLARHSYLCGDALCVADFCVAGMTTYWKRLDFPFDKYPALTAWYEGIHELPAWRATAVRLWA